MKSIQVNSYILFFSCVSLFAFNLQAMNEAQRLQHNAASRQQAHSYITTEFQNRNPDKTLCDVKIITCEDENPTCECGTLKRAELKFRYNAMSWYTVECMATGACVGAAAGGLYSDDVKKGALFGGAWGAIGGFINASTEKHVSVPIITVLNQISVKDPTAEMLFQVLQSAANREEVQKPSIPLFNPEIVEVDRRTVASGLNVPVPSPEMLAALSGFRALRQSSSSSTE